MPSAPARSPFAPVPWVLFGSQNLTLGADLFLQGVLCAQFAHYTNVNQQDSMWMRLFVVGLALLTTLKTLQVLGMVSTQNVALFQSPGAAPNFDDMWLSQMNLILEAGVAFYVQLFFCHRLWALSHNVYIMVVAISLFIFALIAASVGAYFSTNQPKATNLLIATHLGLAMGGDLFQTGSIVFYLLRHSQAVLRHGPVASMLSSLLRLTIQSAAPGAFCALVDFSATIYVMLSPTAGPLAIVISVIANIMLPKSYAMAAMWTLNYRDEIRSAATRVDIELPTVHGVGIGDPSVPEMPKLHVGGVETTSTNSINGPENIQLSSAERKA
ncbi:hypothetical protein B0H16DRAFT_758523 [Mycena metata]|uniref:DUF6534 domain-containing protein n=1 Tax=Mycena metata TaxID=1033252 RepID=A0AAD7GQY4_9AGAR|nr:hypothetical protein B0H16DRAFT_758523 [Mycena metata]